MIASRIALVAFIAGSCCAIPTSAEPASAATLHDLVATTQSLMDALTDNKPDVWKDALTDDASVIDEFGRVQDKAAAVAAVTALPAGFSGHIKLLDASAHEYKDSAVLVCDADEYETVLGQQLHVLYRFTNTFVRRDGAWKVMAMEDVTVPTTPPTLAVAGLHLDDYPGVYRYGPDRAYTVASDGKALSFTTRAGRPATAMLPLARDVFMDDGDEKNLLVFHRDASGAIDSLIERRKFNDLVMRRDSPASP